MAEPGNSRRFCLAQYADTLKANDTDMDLLKRVGKAREEETMRTDVEFKTQDGVTLRASHYLLDQRSGKVPTIVMAHGFSAVREMYLDKFAEVFATAASGRWSSTTGISARAAENRARKSTPGSRSATTAMQSRMRNASGDRRGFDWDMGFKL